ncbi:MAG: hypothetical protein LBT40_04530 [Deltaproteobacteria bacterium]|jgi:hypothetical protein|nr:hypothetical protein [Deltaproteobacteria bacterium]
MGNAGDYSDIRDALSRRLKVLERAVDCVARRASSMKLLVEALPEVNRELAARTQLLGSAARKAAEKVAKADGAFWRLWPRSESFGGFGNDGRDAVQDRQAPRDRSEAVATGGKMSIFPTISWERADEHVNLLDQVVVQLASERMKETRQIFEKMESELHSLVLEADRLTSALVKAGTVFLGMAVDAPGPEAEKPGEGAPVGEGARADSGALAGGTLLSSEEVREALCAARKVTRLTRAAWRSGVPLTDADVNDALRRGIRCPVLPPPPAAGHVRKAEALEHRALREGILADTLDIDRVELGCRADRLRRAGVGLVYWAATLKGRGESLRIQAEYLEEQATCVGPGSSAVKRMVAASLAGRAARFRESADSQLDNVSSALAEASRMRDASSALSRQAEGFASEASGRMAEAARLRDEAAGYRAMEATPLDKAGPAETAGFSGSPRLLAEAAPGADGWAEWEAFLEEHRHGAKKPGSAAGSSGKRLPPVISPGKAGAGAGGADDRPEAAGAGSVKAASGTAGRKARTARSGTAGKGSSMSGASEAGSGSGKSGEAEVRSAKAGPGKSVAGKPGAKKSASVKAGAVKPASVKTDAVNPASVKTDALKPASVNADAVKPASAKAYAGKPVADKADAGKPASGRAGAGRSGSGRGTAGRKAGRRPDGDGGPEGGGSPPNGGGPGGARRIF